MTLSAQDGVDVGFDRIAAQAGVSRTTLYRWWRSPREVLLDALLESVRFSIEVDASTPAIDQLRAHLRSAAEVLTRPPTAAPLRALAAAALGDEAVHLAFRQRWLEPRRAAAQTLVERGFADGSITGADPQAVIDELFGPVYHRAWFTDGPLDEEFINGLLARVASA